MLEDINLYFFFTFFFEMLIKMTGLGLKQYFKEVFNTFDCVIILFGVVEIIMTYTSSSNLIGVVSALRMLRLLRIFKLARVWRGL
jgi:hypothetical protein